MSSEYKNNFHQNLHSKLIGVNFAMLFFVFVLFCHIMATRFDSMHGLLTFYREMIILICRHLISSLRLKVQCPKIAM